MPKVVTFIQVPHRVAKRNLHFYWEREILDVINWFTSQLDHLETDKDKNLIKRFPAKKGARREEKTFSFRCLKK